MTFISGLFATKPFLITPTHLVGWAGFIAFIALIAWGVRQWREDPREIFKRRWWLLVLLLIITPIATTILGISFPNIGQPMPGVPLETGAPTLMILAGIPWVLAAGLLGPIPAVVVGFVSGLFLGLFDTHSIFTPLELAGLALVFSWAVRQRYRTTLFKILRHPIGAALVLGIGFTPIFILSTLFAVNGPLAVRLDYALTQSWLILSVRGGEMLIASIFGEVLYLVRPLWWGCRGPLFPSPTESSIQMRFFFAIVPLVAALVLTLTIGDWVVAGQTARQMMRDRLRSTAQVAADSLPYFLEAGQSLILTMSTPDVVETPPAQLSDLLSQRLRSVPYFRQLSAFDKKGAPLGGYPEGDFNRILPSDEEKTGIALALKGVSLQVYTVSPVQGEKSAQVTFISVVKNAGGEIIGVLLGRTDLESNPFTQPAVEALGSLKDMGGEGIILDENKNVLYPLDAQQIREYNGKVPTGDQFFEDTSPTGTRNYSFYQPAIGKPWAVVLSVPALTTQEAALNIAIPLMVILAIVVLVGFVLLRIGLGSVTSTLQVLANQASLITRGDLNQSARVKGVDEIGRLAEAFEQMRFSLKARLDELNRLLVVSQGVAANLEIHDSVKPILDAALHDGASLARVVLSPDVTIDPRQDEPVAFGDGSAAEQYAYLDSQLYELLKQQDLLMLSNVGRLRRLKLLPGKPVPGSLISMAIRHKNRYYGVFWVAYESPRNFSDEEVRFLTTLSGQIALAAASARLYASAEVGRQRLEAVLASTPDPVLVTDDQSRLLLLNQAALQVPGLVTSANEGQPIQEVVGPPDLIAFIISPQEKRIASRELSLPNGKIYYTSLSAVVVEGNIVGRVCILRDITHFKELDQLKSDFVATVSHDLRSPLTLMRGYSTMLQMVGELNEQQKGYVKKILGGVENMSRLVTNLLDLGRIEAGIGLQIEKVVVQQVIDEVLNSLQMQAVQKEIQLNQETSNGDSPLIVVEADRALLQQALYNLVENAIKYTPVGGQIKIKMEQRKISVILQVIDNGIGIAPLDLPRLFEKFYRSGRRETYQQRGTGLGLAIVKSIAERHNGRVWVDSQLGKGSIFSYEMPIRQPVPEPAVKE
jgi:PAS domain S-box-containing protein